MTTYPPDWTPASTLDETIAKRGDWTPATRDCGAAALLLTATLPNIERAAMLGAVRLALALDPFDTTPTNAPIADESEAA
jgi:hypothetical protein